MSNDNITFQYRTQCVNNPNWSRIKIWKSRFPNVQEKLGREIEKQKQLFLLQHQDENN